MKKLICTLLSLLLFLSLPVPLTFAATARPATPTGVKAVALTSMSIRISWTAVKGAAGYEIYYISDGQAQLLNSTKTTSYTDTDSIAPVHTYIYKVRAYTKAASKVTYSAFSKTVTVFTPLDAPDLLTAEDITSKSIQLSWQTVQEAQGYLIYRALTQKGQYTYLDTTSDTKYLDTTANGDTRYSYKLRSYTVVDGKKMYSPGYSLACTAKTIPNGQKYLNVLFIGNSLTSFPNTNGAFDALCKEMGKYVKVHSVISLGAKLQDIAPMFEGSLYQFDKDNADLVIFQEYGGGIIDSTSDAVRKMMKCFKHAKFYYLPSYAYKAPLSLAQTLQLKDVNGITNFKTYNLCGYLFEQYSDTLFRGKNDFHPNFLYGYASAVLIYSTLYGADPTTLPDDFLLNSTISAEAQAIRPFLLPYIRQAVKKALAAQ